MLRSFKVYHLPKPEPPALKVETNQVMTNPAMNMNLLSSVNEIINSKLAPFYQGSGLGSQKDGLRGHKVQRGNHSERLTPQETMKITVAESKENIYEIEATLPLSL